MNKKEKLVLLQELAFIEVTTCHLVYTKGTEARRRMMFEIWEALERIRKDFDVDSVTKGSYSPPRIDIV